MILSDVLTYKQQQQQNMWFCEMYLLTNRREKKHDFVRCTYLQAEKQQHDFERCTYLQAEKQQYEFVRYVSNLGYTLSTRTWWG